MYEKEIDYMVMIVNEYAIEKNISPKDAYLMLSSYGGIKALEENYEIEHTLSISSTLDALDALCARKKIAI
ncbi:DUF3791 domain-containing protein [Adlercreutzia sp. ZJ304]|uniref:DUF3791 domain-containing protein n=1 Tax=Adlercreutzia sp. ZJ304 TaxID=2709791 RepID=UPI0013EDA294|nr:DUF3791 domain-containing protein [Adlercreutzia sp. ZJ304]